MLSKYLSRIKESCILYVRMLLFNLSHSDYKQRKIDGYYVVISVSGKNNFIRIGKGGYINYPHIKMRGSNNTIEIGRNCHIGPNCSFWVEGNGLVIKIGNKCSFNNNVRLCAQEDNVGIYIGEDCMLSYQIDIRTSDSHPIFNQDTNKRINHARDVTIGSHVWIAPYSKIYKGADIESGSVIGSCSLVSGKVPQNCLAVGSPAKIAKTGISWKREASFKV